MTNMRVEIPAWSDHWMRGDRYGEIIAWYMSEKSRNQAPPNRGNYAAVKLDKSGKVQRFHGDYLTPIL